MAKKRKVSSWLSTNNEDAESETEYETVLEGQSHNEDETVLAGASQNPRENEEVIAENFCRQDDIVNFLEMTSPLDSDCEEEFFEISQDIVDEQEVLEDFDDGEVLEDFDDGEEIFEDATTGFESSLDFEKSLYANAPISIGESLLAILFFCISNKVTATAANALIDLIKLHLPFPNCFPRSYFLFQKYFQPFVGSYIVHDFCEKCLTEFSKDDTHCQKCPDKPLRYIGEQSKKKMSAFFLEIPIESYLEKQFQTEEFLEDLNYKINRKKTVPNNYEDIFDGENFKKYPILSKYGNLSLGFFLDGMSIFHSSNWHMWPLLYVIHDLPPERRFENVALAGLWFGREKPDSNLFLRPLLKSLKRFESQEIEFVTCRQEKIRPVVAPLSFSCDLPAKALLQSVNQFNGEHGCGCCYDKGESLPHAPGARYYPFAKYSILRTRATTLHDASEAIRTKKTYRGVKRPSILLLFPFFDLIWNVVLDYMHACCLGVAKKMMELWFDSSNHEKGFYQGAKAEYLEQLIKQVKTPSFVSRPLRSYKKQGKFWKG
eukprot:Pompholyxophrys_punicea_v1_NODE_153_length_3174_cov_68.242706.p1 type:complete len:545 gc:universal NODE_153_length_3174_cov_68.242706:1269-2903(+)